MFQGMEGYDDIRPGYTKVAEWEAPTGEGESDPDDGLPGTFDDYEIETAAYGMDFEEEDLKVDGNDVAGESARITREVLAGDRTDHWYDAVALNAAVRVYAGGDADSLDDGLAAARDAIDGGSAAGVLDDLRAF
jgi:anthranilate phosphoribosyltransferase